MKQFGMILVTTVAIAMAQPHQSNAGGGHGHKGDSDHHKKMKAELNLTQEQQDQLSALRKEQKAEKKEAMKEGKAQKEALNKLLIAPKIDTKAVDTQIKKISETAADMMEDRVEFLLEVKKIMSPEQFEQYITTQGQRREGKGKKGGCKGKEASSCSKGAAK